MHFHRMSLAVRSGNIGIMEPAEKCLCAGAWQGEILAAEIKHTIGAMQRSHCLHVAAQLSGQTGDQIRTVCRFEFGA